MKGLSLIECLITLFCISLLALISVGSQKSWFMQHQSQRRVEKLVHELQFAREQALLQNTIVTLCPSIDQLNCSSASHWSWGYLVFIDPLGRAEFTNDTEKLFGTKHDHNGILSNSRHYIQFLPNGFTRNSNSTFIYTLQDIQRKVIINLQGRIRVE